MADISTANVSLTLPQPHSRTLRITVRETRCNTLLHKLAYRSSTGYTANLYKGCTHGCVYRYAPSLTHDERRWGTYVDVKVNAPEVLERELRDLKRDEVFLSSASDPYQPVEARYGLTRRCLELLQKNEFPASVLTRSPLVLRDLELLRTFRWARVGLSMTSPIETIRAGGASAREANRHPQEASRHWDNNMGLVGARDSGNRACQP